MYNNGKIITSKLQYFSRNSFFSLLDKGFVSVLKDYKIFWPSVGNSSAEVNGLYTINRVLIFIVYIFNLLVSVTIVLVYRLAIEEILASIKLYIIYVYHNLDSLEFTHVVHKFTL